MLPIAVNIVKPATISASSEIPINTTTRLHRKAYREDKEFGMETFSESIQKIFVADFGFLIEYFDYHRSRILTNEEYIYEFNWVMKI